MIHEPSQIACDRCKREYSLRLGEEPTLLCDACAHEIAEVAWLTKQTPARAELGWRPIAEAPKDGTRILGIWRDGLIETVEWSAFWSEVDDMPTHWQPLPPPPSVES